MFNLYKAKNKQKLFTLHSIFNNIKKNIIHVNQCLLTVREERPGPAADVHPGGALGTAGLGEH